MEILIVDDSRTMRMLVRRSLRQAGYGGATVREAENGVKALEALREHAADLVLADWNMPLLDGLALLQHLRTDFPQVLVGFVTSQCTAAARTTAREAGASFLLAKPFTPEELRDELLNVAPECP